MHMQNLLPCLHPPARFTAHYENIFHQEVGRDLPRRIEGDHEAAEALGGKTSVVMRTMTLGDLIDLYSKHYNGNRPNCIFGLASDKYWPKAGVLIAKHEQQVMRLTGSKRAARGR